MVCENESSILLRTAEELPVPAREAIVARRGGELAAFRDVAKVTKHETLQLCFLSSQKCHRLDRKTLRSKRRRLYGGGVFWVGVLSSHDERLVRDDGVDADGELIVGITAIER